MRGIVFGLVLWVAAGRAAAGDDLDRWHRRADLVIRAEVVQVSAERDAVTVVLDRALRGERPPLALTFAPATSHEGWAPGDRAVLFLRHRLDPGEGPRWDSLATRDACPDAADPLAAAALDRYFSAPPVGAGRAAREARAVQALGGASPALARHGADALEALVKEGPLGETTLAAIEAAGRDRNPVRRLDAVAPLRGLACAGNGSAAALLGHLAGDVDVEVASLAREALAARCRERDGGERRVPAAAVGAVVALVLLAGGLASARSRATRSDVS
jgi:hypothetical protein